MSRRDKKAKPHRAELVARFVGGSILGACLSGVVATICFGADWQTALIVFFVTFACGYWAARGELWQMGP
jgi:hypothetical protein